MRHPLDLSLRLYDRMRDIFENLAPEGEFTEYFYKITNEYLIHIQEKTVILSKIKEKQKSYTVKDLSKFSKIFNSFIPCEYKVIMRNNNIDKHFM